VATRSLRQALAAIVKPGDVLPGFEAFDQLATMVAIVRPDGRCLLANSALENVIGLSRRALQRSNAFEWLADAARARPAARGGQPRGHEPLRRPPAPARAAWAG
jgi:PAS domain-containing protein